MTDEIFSLIKNGTEYIILTKNFRQKWLTRQQLLSDRKTDTACMHKRIKGLKSCPLTSCTKYKEKEKKLF